MKRAEEYIEEQIPIFPDSRTKNWPLMDSNVAICIALAYVLIVLIAPYIVKQLPKLELKLIRVLHNFILTVLNLYLVVEMINQASSTKWYSMVPGEQGIGMAKVLWIYYFSKIIEFIDTFIMIFRHSWDQITFLHVYHHSSVFLIWWFNMYYYPGGEAWPSAWLNSFVHVFMYSYYFFSTLGWQPWWKQILTQLQIAQLSLFFMQGLHLFFFAPAVGFRPIGLVNGVYALSILVLFLNFYNKKYPNARDRERKLEVKLE